MYISKTHDLSFAAFTQQEDRPGDAEATHGAAAEAAKEKKYITRVNTSADL